MFFYFLPAPFSFISLPHWPSSIVELVTREDWFICACRVLSASWCVCLTVCTRVCVFCETTFASLRLPLGQRKIPRGKAPDNNQMEIRIDPSHFSFRPSSDTAPPFPTPTTKWTNRQKEQGDEVDEEEGANDEGETTGETIQVNFWQCQGTRQALNFCVCWCCCCRLSLLVLVLLAARKKKETESR